MSTGGTRYIDNLIKFSAERWKQHCSEYFVKEVEETILKANEESVANFSDELRRQLAICLNGESSYDYTDIVIKDPVVHMSIPVTDMSIENTIKNWTYRCTQEIDYKDRANIWKKAQDIERVQKVILHFTAKNYDIKGNRTTINMTYDWVRVILTNKGHLFCHDQRREKIWHHDYNFDIPRQYAIILQRLYDGWLPPDPNIFFPLLSRDPMERHLSNISLDALHATLIYMKESLYDKSFVPLYVSGIMEENKELVSQYSKFEEDKKEFLERQNYFHMATQGFFDLETQKAEFQEQYSKFEEERSTLKKAIKLLKIKCASLEREREELNDILLSD